MGSEYFDALADLNEACIEAFGEPEPILLDGCCEVSGIWQDQLEEQTLVRNRGPGVAGAPKGMLDSPAVSLLERDAAGIKKGTTVLARGKEYVVVKAVPDVGGMVRLILAQDSPPGSDPVWR